MAKSTSPLYYRGEADFSHSKIVKLQPKFAPPEIFSFHSPISIYAKLYRNARCVQFGGAWDHSAIDGRAQDENERQIDAHDAAGSRGQPERGARRQPKAAGGATDGAAVGSGATQGGCGASWRVSPRHQIGGPMRSSPTVPKPASRTRYHSICRRVGRGRGWGT